MNNLDNEPLLSIVIPTFNGEKTIGKTLNSILKQTNGIGIEIIVSDNCSTDDTKYVVEKFINKYFYIKYFCNEDNLGFDINCDLGVRRSRGLYVWILGDDDMIAPSSLNYILSFLFKNENLVGGFVNFSRMDSRTGKLLSNKEFELDASYVLTNRSDFIKLVNIHMTFISSLIYKRELWVKRDWSKYHECKWIHIPIMLSLLEEGQSFVFGAPVIINNSRGADQSYAKYKDESISFAKNRLYIINELLKIITQDDVLSSDCSNRLVLLNKIFPQVKANIIQDKFACGKFQPKVFINILRIFWKDPKIWFFYLPFYCAPLPLIRFVSDLLVSKKQ